MEVFENETFAGLSLADVDYLRRRLRGNLEIRNAGWAVTRHVGHIALPSGRALVLRSRKTSTSSLLCWVCFMDPTLQSLRTFGEVAGTLDRGSLGGMTALLFLRELRRAMGRHGLTRNYAEVSDKQLALRGRIDFPALSRQGGDLGGVPCRSWQRELNTPLNGFLSAVVGHIARDPELRASAALQVAQLKHDFADVAPRVDRAMLRPGYALPRNETGFARAFHLGRLLLAHSYLGDGAAGAGPSFLVNIEELFERTVARAFVQGGLVAQSKVPLGYERRTSGENGLQVRRQSMEMDVYCSDPRTGLLVVDAKYKTSVSSGNLQQMVTYCFLTGARRGVLVLPAGHGDPGTSYALRAPSGDSVEVHVVELDTSATSVDEWRKSVARLVEGCVAVGSGGGAGKRRWSSPDLGSVVSARLVASATAPPVASH